MEACEEDWQKAIESGEIEGDFEIVPVFPEKSLYDDYYNGFANSTLWPLFHYFPSLVDYRKEFYEDYKKINQLFADKILKIYEQGDLIWVHDYQLMLVLGMVRERVPDARIGFFPLWNRGVDVWQYTNGIDLVARAVAEFAPVWQPRGSLRQMVDRGVRVVLTWIAEHAELYRYVTGVSARTHAGGDSYGDLRAMIATHLSTLAESYLRAYGADVRAAVFAAVYLERNAALLSIACACQVAAQNYPTRPVRVIIAFPPGSATDIIGRLITHKVAELWGQNVVADNRGGADVV